MKDTYFYKGLFANERQGFTKVDDGDGGGDTTVDINLKKFLMKFFTLNVISTVWRPFRVAADDVKSEGKGRAKITQVDGRARRGEGQRSWQNGWRYLWKFATRFQISLINFLQVFFLISNEVISNCTKIFKNYLANLVEVILDISNRLFLGITNIVFNRCSLCFVKIIVLLICEKSHFFR